MGDKKDSAQESLIKKRIRCPLGIYEHYKGGSYIVFGHSVDESTLDVLVHYYSLEKKTRWTRTAENFLADGVGTYVNKRRFRFVRMATRDELLLAIGLPSIDF